MANFLRLLLGLMLLPACWGVARAFPACLAAATASSGWLGAETLSLLGGLVAFSLVWLALPHPVRAYVLGHELTHALWGLLFGARPSRLRVRASGGSVQLTKSNMLITLAPYFFPFYTFTVLLVAGGVMLFVRPLPCRPLWLFSIGFTWAFHVLFTLETLTHRQPDITLYGRVFSWVLVFLLNALLVLVALASVTPLSFADLARMLFDGAASAYSGVVMFVWSLVSRVRAWLTAVLVLHP